MSTGTKAGVAPKKSDEEKLKWNTFKVAASADDHRPWKVLLEFDGHVDIKNVYDKDGHKLEPAEGGSSKITCASPLKHVVIGDYHYCV